MRSAMPDREQLPVGWRGEAAPEVIEGEKARTRCLMMAATCASAGVVAIGSDTYDEGTVNRPEGDSEHTAQVVVLSFESAKGAKTVMRSLVKGGRSAGSQQLVKIEAGAQDTEAWSKRESGLYTTQLVMRVDRVVIALAGEDLKQPADLEPVAKTLVERVKEAAQ
ncbi:hypothetical protein ACIQ6Y_09445 [Streptomyces sp. NPDC096205]|uniref:hypothetical protein n=1 Tax=Streptomyces sp. NPDC096205 TaxID=3366081 RepID=UPI0037F372CC